MIEPRQNNNTTLTAPTPKNNEIINPLLEKDTISSSNNYYAIWYVVGAYAFSNYLVRVTIGFVAVAMENDLKKCRLLALPPRNTAGHGRLKNGDYQNLLPSSV